MSLNLLETLGTAPFEDSMRSISSFLSEKLLLKMFSISSTSAAALLPF
jgi:hypothetical protein